MNKMKKKRSYFIAVIAFVTVSFASSCHKDNNNQPVDQSCNISTTPATLPSTQTINYTVAITGTTTVSTVTYKDASGADAKVNNPAVPFSVSVDGLKNAPIGITVTGTAAAGGKIVAGYVYGSSNNIVTSSVDCSH